MRITGDEDKNMVAGISGASQISIALQSLSKIGGVSSTDSGLTLQNIEDFRSKVQTNGKDKTPFSDKLVENFDKIDTDKSGSISKDEMKTFAQSQNGGTKGMSHHGRHKTMGLSSSMLQNMLASSDEDDSNSTSADELSTGAATGTSNSNDLMSILMKQVSNAYSKQNTQDTVSSLGVGG